MTLNDEKCILYDKMYILDRIEYMQKSTISKQLTVKILYLVKADMWRHLFLRFVIPMNHEIFCAV